MPDSTPLHPAPAAAGESPLPVSVVTYEQRLSQERSWALDEGFRYFQGMSAPQDTLRRIANRLNDLGIPYAVAGGMALFHHGFRRFTEDVDILVTRESLDEIHAHLDGLGYVRPYSASKNLRDVQTGVRIEFLISGGYPGDGKEKPVVFPDPAAASELTDGIRYITLPMLIDLKLASGMTNPLRGKDLADVQELIQTLQLPRAFAAQLNEFVQPKFEAIWDLIHATPVRYVTTLRDIFSARGVNSIEELLSQTPPARERLNELKQAGLQINDATTLDTLLITTDAELARKLGMTRADDDL